MSPSPITQSSSSSFRIPPSVFILIHCCNIPNLWLFLYQFTLIICTHTKQQNLTLRLKKRISIHCHYNYFILQNNNFAKDAVLYKDRIFFLPWPATYICIHLWYFESLFYPSVFPSVLIICIFILCSIIYFDLIFSFQQFKHFPSTCSRNKAYCHITLFFLLMLLRQSSSA